MRNWLKVLMIIKKTEDKKRLRKRRLRENQKKLENLKKYNPDLYELQMKFIKHKIDKYSY